MRICLCGEELSTIDTVDGVCPKCRNRKLFGAFPSPSPSPSPNISGGIGWECPRCGTVHAPFIARCDCPPPVHVRYSSSTEIEDTKLFTGLESIKKD